MQKIRLGLLIALAMTTLSLGGCTINLSGKSVDDSKTGGVFKTEDFGQTWQQKGLIPTTSGQPMSMAGLDVLDMTIDPSDNQAVYFGSYYQGLYFSYDGGNSWQFAKNTASRPIASVVVDSKDKCRIYIGTNNKVFRTEDCSRTWKMIYSDNDTSLLVHTMVVDHYNPAIVYMGNSRGDVYKSEDYGSSWRRLNNFNNPVLKIVMSPADSRTLLVGTKSKGVFRTIDSGETWTDLTKALKAFPGYKDFKDLVSSQAQAGLWLLATKYGVLRTVNNGDDWTALTLLTEEREATIRSMAISHQDVKKIYYVTDTAFYSTFDAGATWKSNKLPSTRRGWYLLPDPLKDGVLYLGVRQKQS